MPPRRRSTSTGFSRASLRPANVTTIPAAPSPVIPASSKRSRCWEEMAIASPLTSLRSISISRSLSLPCISCPYGHFVRYPRFWQLRESCPGWSATWPPALRSLPDSATCGKSSRPPSSQRGEAPRRWFDQMKTLRSARSLVGRYATAEPEGHASQCDFFMRAKVRLQVISAVSLVSHTLLNDKRWPLDWCPRIGRAVSGLYGSPACPLRKSRGRPHLLQQADAAGTIGACRSFGRSCSPALAAFRPDIRRGGLGAAVLVWWSRKID